MQMLRKDYVNRVVSEGSELYSRMHIHTCFVQECRQKESSIKW